MKYELSIDSQAFFPDKLDGIKWNDLHYPPKSTNEERSEIDKLVNEQIRGKKALHPLGYEFKDTYDCILDQKNVDRQVEIIKKSGRPGLLFFIRAKRI